jgi:hypothetical protein
MTSWTGFGIDSTSLEQLFFATLLRNHTFMTFVTTHSSLATVLFTLMFLQSAPQIFDWAHVWRITRPIKHADFDFLNELLECF